MMIRAPEFWSQERRDWRASLLMPAAWVYSAIAKRRFRRAPTGRAAVPVICIGNPTVGGAGKTPVARLVAARLAAMGRRPVFLSRGYGGQVRKASVVDPEQHDAEAVGDEPLLLAGQAPTVVSPDRIAGAKLAETLGDVVVMDDGFQSPGLTKDLSLLVVDSHAGLGNGLPLPAGPLRLPLADQLASAQAVMLIGSGDKAAGVRSAAQLRGLPILRADLAPAAEVAARLLGRRVIAYAGIGRPGKLFATLERIGARPVETRSFADHHRYTEQEAVDLLALSQSRDAVLVTTEKDMMRLEGGCGALARLAAESVMLPVAAVPDAASDAVLDALLARLVIG